ncbi:MAG: zinc-binding dehydrogenase, partial [Enterococcus sp.]
LPADLRFDYIAVLHDIAPYFEQLTPLIKPFGHLGTIVETAPLDLKLLKNKSASFDWEYMFAKTDYAYQLESQGAILEHLAHLVDTKKIQSTVTKTYDGLTVANLKRATQDVETGHMVGKVVISGAFSTQLTKKALNTK